MFVNGNWIGNHPRPNELIQDIKRLRRDSHENASLPKEYSIVRDIDKREIKIYTDSGRCLRSMFIVEDNLLKLKKSHVEKVLTGDWMFEDFKKNGLIELLDVEEEESAMIAMFIRDIDKNKDKYQYTHCEIHPSMILGVCASIIPFPDHN